MAGSIYSSRFYPYRKKYILPATDCPTHCGHCLGNKKLPLLSPDYCLRPAAEKGKGTHGETKTPDGFKFPGELRQQHQTLPAV